MPRLVVPMRVAAPSASRSASSSRCSGRISVAFSAIRSLSGVTLIPCLSSCAISSSSACGSTTTPLPMTESLPSRTTPEGRSESLNTALPMTKVWPALWPPWKRTTMSACSDSQSTILPLPSSPHCDPTTTTFAMNDDSLPAPGHLKPGAAGQVHSRIMDREGRSKAKRPPAAAPEGPVNSLILRPDSQKCSALADCTCGSARTLANRPLECLRNSGFLQDSVGCESRFQLAVDGQAHAGARIPPNLMVAAPLAFELVTMLPQQADHIAVVVGHLRLFGRGQTVTRPRDDLNRRRQIGHTVLLEQVANHAGQLGPQ